METTKSILKWSLIISTIIAIYWFLHYLLNGTVPVIHFSNIPIINNWVIKLPCNINISRWWDILLGPIWSIVIIIFYKKSWIEEESPIFYLIAIPIYLLILSMLFKDTQTDPNIGLSVAIFFAIFSALSFKKHVYQSPFILGFDIAVSFRFGIVVCVFLFFFFFLVIIFKDYLKNKTIKLNF